MRKKYTRNIKNLGGRLNSTDIKAQYVINYSLENRSRYKHVDELLLSDNKIIKATMSPVDLGIVPYDGGTWFTVTSAEENRIDVIATKYYGAASLYWIICYANVIEDPLHLPVGKTLYIPNISALQRFPNPLS